jgi:hypothetical protein
VAARGGRVLHAPRWVGFLECGNQMTTVLLILCCWTPWLDFVLLDSVVGFCAVGLSGVERLDLATNR